MGAGAQLKILFVMGSLYQQSSGPYHSLRDTARALQSLGHHPVVVGSRDRRAQGDPTDWGGIPAVALPKLGPYSLHYTPSLTAWLKRRETAFDVVSFQSVWQYNNYLAARWCRQRAIPYLITTHGNLNARALEISSWKKRIAQRWFVHDMFSQAACFHALTTAEYRAIRAYGITRPVCIIPNGIGLPEENSATVEPADRICLYLGRFHQIKNLRALVAAWAELGAVKRGWRLALAGSDDGGEQPLLENEINRLGLTREVIFTGPVYGAEKQAWFQRAAFFVLPSLSEGFPVTLLEAMAARRPVVYTSGCHLPEIAAQQAGIETGPAVAELRAGLIRMMQMSETERAQMGTRGFQLVKERYQWPQIAAELVKVYQWMIEAGPPPASVIFD